jgi:pimeloyl-ACP methyl ester carboxylesterase
MSYRQKPETIMWQPHIGVAGRKIDVPIEYYGFAERPDVMVLPGLGEELRVSEYVFDALNKIGARAIVPIVNFDKLKPTPANIERAAKEMPIAIAEAVGVTSRNPIRLTGASQGGAIAVLAALTEESLFSSIVLIEPSSLTNEQIIADPKRYVDELYLDGVEPWRPEDLAGVIHGRGNEFIRRIARNTLDPSNSPFSDRRNFAIGGDVLMRFARDLGTRKLRPKMNYAFGLNLTSGIRQLVDNGHEVDVIVGGGGVFTEQEYRKALSIHGLEDRLHVTDGYAHISIGSKRGTERLLVAQALHESYSPAA